MPAAAPARALWYGRYNRRQSGRFCLLGSQVPGELVNHGADDLQMSQLLGADVRQEAAQLPYRAWNISGPDTAWMPTAPRRGRQTGLRSETLSWDTYS